MLTHNNTLRPAFEKEDAIIEWNFKRLAALENCVVLTDQKHLTIENCQRPTVFYSSISPPFFGQY